MLEANGAVDFTHDDSLGNRNIFDAVASVIEAAAGERSDRLVALAD